MDGFFQSRNQPRYRKAVAASPLGEEERNLEKWPMTSSDCSKMTSSTLITQHYTNLATCYNNKLTSLIYDGDRAVDWKQAKMMEGSSATT